METNLNNFAVFILTHGRPDNIITKESLDKAGYTGRIYYIVDNEDKRLNEYIENYGDLVQVFDKKYYADLIDEGNNFDHRGTPVHARNATFDIAKKLGIKYFIQFDDDYTCFHFRFVNKLGKVAFIKDFDKIFLYFINFYKNTNILSIAFGQGGDHIGGFSGTKMKRKAMNSFLCSTDRVFDFVGALNDDVNTYVMHGIRGKIFFTYTSIQLDQKPTQQQKAGITDMYLLYGTYCKSFTTVLMAPSSVKVYMMNTSNPRLHHKINWKTTVPKILLEKYKKQINK